MERMSTLEVKYNRQFRTRTREHTKSIIKAYKDALDRGLYNAEGILQTNNTLLSIIIRSLERKGTTEIMHFLGLDGSNCYRSMGGDPLKYYKTCVTKVYQTRDKFIGEALLCEGEIKAQTGHLSVTHGMNNTKDSNNVGIFTAEQKRNPDQNYINKINEERAIFDDKEQSKLEKVIVRHRKQKEEIERKERESAQILGSARRESEERDQNTPVTASELRDSETDEQNNTDERSEINPESLISPPKHKTDFNKTFTQNILDRDSILDSLQSFNPITPTIDDSILDLLEVISPMSEPMRRKLDFEAELSPLAVGQTMESNSESKMEQFSDDLRHKKQDLLDFDTDSHSITKFQMLLNMSSSEETRNTLAHYAIEAEHCDKVYKKRDLSIEDWERKFRHDTKAKILQSSQPVSDRVFEKLIDLQMYCLERSENMDLLPRDASNDVKLKNHIYGSILGIIPYRSDPNKHSHF